MKPIPRYSAPDKRVYRKNSPPKQSMMPFRFNKPRSPAYGPAVLRKKSQKGTLSLVQTATNLCIKHIDELDASHFEGVPWYLVEPMWDVLLKS